MSLLFHLKSPFTEPFPASPGTRVPPPPPSHPGGTHTHTCTQSYSNKHIQEHTQSQKKSVQQGGEEKKTKGISEFLFDVTHCALELNDTSNTHISKKEKECRVHQKKLHSIAPPGTIPTRLSYRYTVFHSSITALLCRGLRVHTYTHQWRAVTFLTRYAEC